MNSTIPARIRFALLAVTATLAMTAAVAAEAQAKGPGTYGYKYATKSQKQVLKRVAARKVINQDAWYVSKSSSPRWAIVCGSDIRGTALTGAAYRAERGRWVYREPFSSGGMQTVDGLCAL